MKVLHSYKVYRPDLDGGIPFVIATLTHPADDDIENRVLVARLRGWGRHLDVDQIPVEAVASLGTVFSTPLSPAFPFILSQRAKTADVVVHHAPFPLADFALPHLPENVALVVYWHADIVGRPLLKLPFRRAILQTLQRANRIIVSDDSTIASSEILPAFREKCAVVPYGVDVARWRECSAEEAAQAALVRERYPQLIVAIGRLVPYKGFDVLIKALKSVDAQLVIIGEGPLRADLGTQALNEGVSDRVVFKGRISESEIKAYLHAARVFAFPSVTTAEAFGIVQLEAMAAGLPIVNTSLPTAVPTVARNEREALTVSPRNPKQLAAALTRILHEPGLAQKMGDAAQNRVRDEYSQEQYIARIKNIFRDAVRTKRAPLVPRRSE